MRLHQFNEILQDSDICQARSPGFRPIFSKIPYVGNENHFRGLFEEVKQEVMIDLNMLYKGKKIMTLQRIDEKHTWLK